MNNVYRRTSHPPINLVLSIMIHSIYFIYEVTLSLQLLATNMTDVRFLTGAKDFSVLYNVQTSTEAHIAS